MDQTEKDVTEQLGEPDVTVEDPYPVVHHEHPLTDEIPYVESPYAGQHIGVWQNIRISSFWFASNFIWGALLLVMLPHEIKILAPDNRAATLGLITGAAALVALFVPLLVGALSDRCASKWGRRRPYIATGVCINLVGLVAMATAFETRNIGLYFLAFMMLQFGNNVASAAFSGIIPDLIPEDQRGAASGYMAVMSQFGTLLGALLTGFFLEHASEPVRYALIGCVMASVSAVTLFGIKETPLPKKPPPLRIWPYIKSLWIDPREFPDFAWVWITRALVMLGFYSILPFIQYYLSDIVHVAKPEKTAPILLSLILVGATLSGYFGGAISDRIGRKRVVYIANMIIATMTIALIFCTTIAQTLFVGMIFGIGYGAYISVDWALGTDVLPNKKDAAKDMAVWHISMTLPQSIGGPIAGFILAAFGQYTLRGIDGPEKHYHFAGYAVVFTLSACAFALGALLLRNVRKAN